MKKLFFVVLTLIHCVFVFSSPADTIPANNSFIEYAGRVDFSNPLAPRYSYSGVSVRTCFQGTSISAILEDEKTKNEYIVIVDKVVTKRFRVSKGKKVYVLASGLVNKTHEIELYKITEEFCGKTTFCGFIVDKGKKLVALKDPRERLIEYIGNSIMCGGSVEIPNGEKGNSTNENHYLSYAAITSRNLNAKNQAVCKSGVALFASTWGKANITVESQGSMRNCYSRTFFGNATPIFTFAQKPDLICCNLGTNDFGKSADSASFTKCYIDFIDTLQTRNKHADIICLVGPRTTGELLAKLRRCVKFAVDSANARNNGKVYFFELSTQGALGYGGGYHPTIAQHAKNAKELTEYISKIKGWEITPSTTTYLNVRQGYKTMHSNVDTCKFGDVALATPQTISFILENVGGGTIHLKGTPRVSVSGAGFSLESDAPSVITAGESYTFQVKLAPSAVGEYNGTVSIAIDELKENNYNFSISGIGN
ncbi:MAG: hypothetical protein PF489_01775 [Salinivirgaceae bacterium]|jgi:hypothetical protein|nr:hypothetical protein [Salinivirgaceae bacterium]